jgi:hypothetical protein
MPLKHLPYSQHARAAEQLETGDRVPVDQTITIRLFKARKKVRHTTRSQCQGGCGAYLTEDEKSLHECTGPQNSPIRPVRHATNNNALRVELARQKAALAARIAAAIAAEEAQVRAARKAWRRGKREAIKAGNLAQFIAAHPNPFDD